MIPRRRPPFAPAGPFGYLGDSPAAVAAGQGQVPVSAQAMDQAQAIPNVKDRRFWFTYQTPNIASIAPAATTTNAIQFDNDSVFEWVKLTYSCDLTNAAQTISSLVVADVTVQIQDTGQGAYYSNAPIPLQCYAGNATLPFVLPAPQYIQPNASLQFTFANFSTSGGGNQTYNNLRVQLHGFKVKLV